MPKKKRVVLLAALIPALVIASPLILSIWIPKPSLELTVVDAVSGAWVWNASIRVQDRHMQTYFQSDHGPVPLVFRELRRGNWEIHIAAPHYAEQTVPVRIRSGRNKIAEPISMVGLEIPNLDRFVVAIEGRQEKLLFEIRSIGKDGEAVGIHPCIDLWFGINIFEQTEGKRGASLYSGEVDWTWDHRPESVFRYYAELPCDALQSRDGSTYVVNSLVVVLKKIDREDLSSVLARVYKLQDESDIRKYLEGFSDQFDYYLPPAVWDVRCSE